MKNIPNDCKYMKVALIKHQGDTDRREQLSSPEFAERTWIKSKSSFAHSRCRKQDVIREDKVLFVLHSWGWKPDSPTTLEASSLRPFEEGRKEEIKACNSLDHRKLRVDLSTAVLLGWPGKAERASILLCHSKSGLGNTCNVFIKEAGGSFGWDADGSHL